MNPNLAIVFPGQGSQSVGMLAELASEHTEVKATFDEASDVLGYDLWKLTQAGPAQELNKTDNTQPAMFAAGVAVWRVWVSQGGPTPAVMAGHSLGEYTALAGAGAVEFSAAVALVRKRAELMQQAVPEGTGAMAAILGLDPGKVVSICAEAQDDEVVSAVNFNSPQQVVIAGHVNAVENVMARAKQAGAKRALRLAVSVPSHCTLMKPAADKFAALLDATPFKTPTIPVIYNVDVAMYKNEDAIREGLAKQLYNPVRWVETIQTIATQGVQIILECGPGKVLVGLNKRIEKSMPAVPVFDPESLAIALKTIT